MSDSTKDLLPDEWWAIAECVDAYEAESRDAFPDLQKYAQRAPDAFRSAALAELVKVDLERRWSSGDRRRVEQYLKEYPDLQKSSDYLAEVVQQECFVRSKHGEQPSGDELRSRFPDLDQRRVLQTDEYLINTIAFGVNPTDTKMSEDVPAAERTGTVFFDSKKVSGSSGAASESSRGPVSEAAIRTKSGGSGSTTGGSATIPPSPITQPAASDLTTLGESEVRSSAQKPKDFIGRYSIKRTLGSGSFGMVYHCFDEDLKRDVAIKVPHGATAGAAARVKEFMHEAQSAARLKHPGIVTVMDTSQSQDGRVYIVYEFIAGTTLQQSLDEGKYTYEDAARWVADVGDALHYAHKQGIVHRDIKPANILLDKEGKTYVADFGLAKLDDQFFKNDAGRVLGTVAYMSPEQAAGQSHWATPQTDIYSLGVMLYQFLTRRLPFSSGSSATDVLEQIKLRIPPPPRTIDDKIPKALEEVCLKAMAKSPADRYRTAADLAADLRKAIAGAPPKSRTPWLAIAAGGAAAAVIILAVWAPWRKSKVNIPDPAANAAGTKQIVSEVLQQVGALSIKVKAGTPTLDVRYQKFDEQSGNHSIRDEKYSFVAGEKDKVKFDAIAAGGEPRYLYVYWYDTDGKPARIWPDNTADLNAQEPLASVTYPGRNKFFQVDASKGCEVALAFATQHPLTKSELDEFEKLRPFAAGEVVSKKAYEFGSEPLMKEIHRGLGTVVEAREGVLSPQFEEALKQKSAAYNGMVIPHQ